MDEEVRYAEPIDISADVVITDVRPRFIGNYSYVYIGRFRNDLVAIKVLKPVNGATMTSMRRKMERERRVWAALEHPNIVPLCGYAEGEEWFGSFGALVSPWYQNGNAGQYLERYGKSLTINARVAMWSGVVAGVRFLHTFDPCIVHGDLKPGNVLIDDQRNPRLCDFGLTRIYADEPGSGLTTTSEHTGTERYLAFELVVSDTTPIPSTPSDVWALGCVGLEMIFLQMPYANRQNNRYGHIIRDILAGVPPALRPEALDKTSAFVWDILGSCWTKETASRMSIEVVYHAIMGKGLDHASLGLDPHDHGLYAPSQTLDGRYSPQGNDRGRGYPLGERQFGGGYDGSRPSNYQYGLLTGVPQIPYPTTPSQSHSNATTVHIPEPVLSMYPYSPVAFSQSLTRYQPPVPTAPEQSGSNKGRSLSPKPRTQLTVPIQRTHYKLLAQIEYYFSHENLAKDLYLREQMDSKGWVSLQVLQTFPRIHSLKISDNLICDALLWSQHVEVQQNHVRMTRNEWRQYVRPDAIESAISDKYPLVPLSYRP